MIWGDKTVAWFDVWSIEHFISGVTAGGLVYLIFAKTLFKDKQLDEVSKNIIAFIAVMFLAYLWETAEHYMENGTTGVEAVTYWFQGVEFWGNRLITDPLLVGIGGIIGIKYKILAWPARVFSFTWLFVHIFVFPHCMHLHDVFGWD